jgi:5-methylcytosine-specific restriction enzyme A
MEYTPGKEYKRTDIHEKYGGQRQGGISTPSGHPFILIFSGDGGESFGYQDGWDEEGRFYYTGEGQVGNMEFVRGNRAIRDHIQDGKTIHLFFYTRSAFVKYEGELECVDYETIKTHDREGDVRSAIRFILEKNTKESSSESQPRNLATKRFRQPNKTERQGLVTSRVGQGYYRQEIINKFEGMCAVTGCNLAEILIASHIVPWRECNDDERLDVENGLLLCPNYDALFDKHLISFGDDGRIIISGLLLNEEIDNLFIDKDASISVSNGMKPYLERHRSALR